MFYQDSNPVASNYIAAYAEQARNVLSILI